MWGFSEINNLLVINPVTFLQGDGAEVFNYCFTVVMASGMIGWGIGLLCKIISRS